MEHLCSYVAQVPQRKEVILRIRTSDEMARRLKIFREEHALHNLGEALEMLLEIAGVKETSEGRKPRYSW